MLQLAWSKVNREDEADRDTGDPLGFKACCHEVARILVPGLTQRTQLVRGFSLLALGLQKIQNRTDSTELFLRFESLIVGSQVRYYMAKKQNESTPFSGKEQAARLLQESDSYDLKKRLLTNQLAGGIWGSYRKASSYFGLIESRGGRSTSPSVTELTTKGKNLAEEAKCVLAQNFHLMKYLKEGEIPLDQLCALGMNLDKPTDTEVKQLTETINEVDITNNHALRKLYEHWKHTSTTLTLNSLNPMKLTADQRGALSVAKALVRLMEAIEGPWRIWVTGGESEISHKVGQMDEWETLENWGGSAAIPLDLQKMIASQKDSKTVFNAIQEHHLKLCSSRSAKAWEKLEDIGPADKRGQFDPYDFCLGSASSLFGEGVAP